MKEESFLIYLMSLSLKRQFVSSPDLRAIPPLSDSLVPLDRLLSTTQLCSVVTIKLKSSEWCNRGPGSSNWRWKFQAQVGWSFVEWRSLVHLCRLGERVDTKSWTVPISFSLNWALGCEVNVFPCRDPFMANLWWDLNAMNVEQEDLVIITPYLTLFSSHPIMVRYT